MSKSLKLLGTLGLGLLFAACGNTTNTDAGTGDMAITGGGGGDMATGGGGGGDMTTAGGGGDMATGTGGMQVMVGMGGFTFSPSTMTIKVGDTVKWVWASSGHNVIADDGSFCSPSDTGCNMPTTVPTSNSGDTYSHKFTTAGSFPYHCQPHMAAGMKGTITVQ